MLCLAVASRRPSVILSGEIDRLVAWLQTRDRL